MSVLINGTEYEFDINFYWINKSLDEKQQYIIPTTGNNDDEHSADLDLHCKSMYDIATTYNSQDVGVVAIILWYDSKVTTADTVHRTKVYFEIKMTELGCYRFSISVNDIRSKMYIDQYRNDTEIDRAAYNCFMDSKISVYFRADFIRMVIANRTVGNAIKNNRNYIHVFSNLDIISFGETKENPFALDTLFDSETKSKLCKSGFLLAHNVGSSNIKYYMNEYYENNFFMLSTCNKNTFELHRCFEDYIKIKCEPDCKTNHLIRIDPEVVFKEYEYFIRLILEINGYIKNTSILASEDGNTMTPIFFNLSELTDSVGSFIKCKSLNDNFIQIMTESYDYKILPDKQNFLINPYFKRRYYEIKDITPQQLSEYKRSNIKIGEYSIAFTKRELKYIKRHGEFKYYEDIFWPNKKVIIGTQPRGIYKNSIFIGNIPQPKPI
jgi:hypothetical protein